MRSLAWSIAPLLALAALGCGADEAKSAPEAGPPPPFRVERGFVRDADGRALVLRGMNVSGAQKHAPWFDFHGPDDFARLRDAWGMNSMRFLITWAAVEPEKGKYDGGYLDELAKRMQWAKDAGVFVVLDMHQDVYGEGFASGGGDGAPRWTCDEASYASFVPNPSQWFLNYLTPEVTGCYDHFWESADLEAHYVEAWRRVAERLAGFDDTIVGVDVMNEPYWGSYPITAFEADRLEPLYEAVIAAVRAERPHWVAFLEPASSRNLGVATGLVPFSFGSVVYSPHSYDRDAESGKGFDPTHAAAVAANAKALAKEAQGLGAALWVGEYGGVASAPGIADYMDAEYAAIGAVAGGSSYWEYGADDGYGVLASDGSEKKELLDALVRPAPERVAGDIESWSFDAAKRTFTLRYRPDRAIHAPTTIFVPARAYPNGHHVDCGGCTWSEAGGQIAITEPAAGDAATITISP